MFTELSVVSSRQQNLWGFVIYIKYSWSEPATYTYTLKANEQLITLLHDPYAYVISCVLNSN